MPAWSGSKQRGGGGGRGGGAGFAQTNFGTCHVTGQGFRVYSFMS